MKFIDLFAGVGGFHYGLERASSIKSEQFQGKELQEGKDSNSIKSTKREQSNFSCVWANEWDKYAAEIYKKRFPNTPFFRGDIRTVDTKRLPDFDLLVGGFPCQAFSIAGKRRGFEETRGTLFFEIVRIAKEKRPSLLLLENVKGLLSHDKGRTFATILQTLDEIGYDAEWEVLNSKNFGVPQNRERVFIIGHLRGERSRKVFPIEQNSEKIENESKINVIGTTKNKEAKGTNSRHWVHSSDGLVEVLGSTDYKQPKQIEINQVGCAYRTRSYMNQEGKIEIRKDKVANQLTTVQKDSMIEITSHSPRTNDPKLGGSGPLRSKKYCFTIDRTPHIVNKIRRLTPVECERLQGFPDGWTKGLSDTQRYKCMGNAVTTKVVTAIGEKIIQTNLF